MSRLAAVATVALAGLVACSVDNTARPAPTSTAAVTEGPTTSIERREGGPGAKPTACSLVSRDEAQAIVKATLEGGDDAQGTSDTNSICSYHTADRLLLVRVSPQTGERDHAAFPFGTPEPVPGLGDDAKYAPGEGQSLSALSVLRGPVGLTVLYRGPGDHLAICTEVARTALAKL